MRKSSSQRGRVGPVGPGDPEFVQEARDSCAQGAHPVPARGLRECGAEEGLPHTRLADDDHVLLVLDPLASGEVADDGLVEAARGIAPDVLEGGVRDAQARGPHQARQSAVLPVGPFAVHHERDLFGEGQLAARRLREQIAEGLGHGGQAQVHQFSNGLFVGHGVSVSFRS
jgi:hypothetical protein